MDRLNVGIIGTGGCGGIRAEASAKNGLVDQLHICDCLLYTSDAADE